jgi:M6 family metalloprotease-like protein
MIKDALDALQKTGFNFSPFDTDNDGNIDAIGFLHSGYGAEWGGTDAYGAYYLDRIWSHKWSLFSLPGGKWTSSNGKSVYNYHISPALWGKSGSSIGRISVIAHETGHFFGLPDLYDVSFGWPGIGSYCLMANGWGFDGSQYYPPLLSAWAKIQVGWVSPTVITAAGTYTARKACDFPDVFQISKNFPSGEYLLIENRQKCKFDALMAGPGLAIFHIDDSATNTAGYPGQTGWPTNGNHYKVALLQADGSYSLEKNANRGDATDLFYSGGVNSITSAGVSSGAAHPNTKAYKGGTILDTGISITSIGPSSDSMSFSVSFGATSPVPAHKPATITKPLPKPLVMPISKPAPIKPAKPVGAAPKPAKPAPTKPAKPAPTKPTLAPVKKPTR